MAFSRYRRRPFRRSFRKPAYSRFRHSSMKPRTWKRKFRKFRRGPRTEFKQITSEAQGNIGTIYESGSVPDGVNAPLTAIVLNGIPQGAGSTQRVGRLITNKSILLQGTLENLNPQKTATVKISLIIDRSPNSISFSGATEPAERYARYQAYKDLIWQPQTINASDVITKMRNPLYKERFKVLQTKLVNLGPGPLLEGDPSVLKFQGSYPNKRPWKIYQKLKSKSTYNSANAMPIEKNQLILFIESNEVWWAPSTLKGVKATWNAQYSYTDA